MKLPMLSGIVLLGAASAFAQTPATSAARPTSTPNQSLTLTGCVGGGNNAEPFTLSNPVVVPGNTATPTATGATAVPPAATPNPPAAVPPSTAAGTTGGAGTTGSATAGTVGATGAAGTAGTATAGAAGTAGTAGATGTAGTAAAGATPTTAGTATAGTMPGSGAASGMNGYRLSGTDMTSWNGQRVQIVGTVIPGAPGATPPAGTAPLPEFRVQSVQPVAGPCPR